MSRRNRSLDSITNQSVNLLIDSVLKRHEVKRRKPRLSAQEKRKLKNLLVDLESNVNKLVKTIKK
ncbi:hypothetical protein [Ureibacillus thermosphaericus]|uniref:hypothetical protein n=1 Tax=Ureibacillus thermosphaericus TaxID=51173 RepID=UPI0030C8F2F9